MRVGSVERVGNGDGVGEKAGELYEGVVCICFHVRMVVIDDHVAFIFIHFSL